MPAALKILLGKIFGRHLLNLFFIATNNDNNDFEQLQQKRHQAAIDALTFLVSKYSPTTAEDADTFYTTTEIANAIAQHNGTTLDPAEIYDLMTQMNY